MDWIELTVECAKEAEEAIANILNEHGANGVVIEERFTEQKRPVFGEIYDEINVDIAVGHVRIKAYFLNDATWEEKRLTIEQNINKLANYGIHSGALTMNGVVVQQSAWEHEWKQYFKPLRITDRFTIVPLWETYERTDEDELIIHMDPGMAFGTGTHATTQLSIAALETYVTPNDTVIDVGSGSGILSIAACLLGASHVYSYDLDQVAVRSTALNSEINNVSERMTVQQKNLLQNVILEHQVDVIVANILAHIIIELMDDAKRLLSHNGYFIISGIIEKEVENIRKQLTKRQFVIIDEKRLNHWVTFVAKNSNR